MKTLICSFVIAIALVQSSFAAGSAGVSPEIEKAILSENWKEVIRFVPDSGTNSLTPVLRLIKAHALLADNKNNEAICLFESLSKADIAACLGWAEDRHNSQPEVLTYLYFLADTLARSSKWSEADQAVSKLLDRDPNQALALNLRGAIRTMTTNFTQAFSDFDSATQINPKLADGWCNLGMSAVAQQEGAKAAIADFGRAISINTNFALAYQGRGYLYCVVRKWDLATNDLTHAIAEGTCFSAFLDFAMERAVAVAKAESIDLANNTPSRMGQPGFSVDATFRDRIDRLGKGDLGLFGSVFKSSLNDYKNDPQKLELVWAAARNGLHERPANQPYLGKYSSDVLNFQKFAGVRDSVQQNTAYAFKLGGEGNFGKPEAGAGAKLNAEASGERNRNEMFHFPMAFQQHQDGIKNLETIGDRNGFGARVNPGGLDAGEYNPVFDSGKWPFPFHLSLFPAETLQNISSAKSPSLR